MTMTVIDCSARLARALGHKGAGRRGWADHHHIRMKVPSALVDTLIERTVYEWRTERDYTVYDATDERCAELHAAFRARQIGLAESVHVSALGAETSQCVAHTHTGFGDFVVIDVVDELRDEVVAVAWGSATEAFEAGC